MNAGNATARWCARRDGTRTTVRSFVAQAFSLPYRRLSVGQGISCRGRGRLEVCDTADRRSALPRRPVAQAFSLPYRRLSVGQGFRIHGGGRLEVCDTADRRSALRRLAAVLFLALAPCLLSAQTAIDEASPWPRVRSTNGNTVTLHLPQVERWTSNWFVARAVVAVKPANTKKDTLGVIWFEAHGSVNRSNRIVTLDRFEITRGRFPEATDNGSNALALVREVVPAGARTVSLDYLVTALGFEQAAARQGAQGLKHDPPEIVWATNRSVLILVDGDPVLRPVTNTALERVINTPVLMVQDKASARFYLESDGRWFAAESLPGPWSLVQTPPAEVAALAPAKPQSPPAAADEPAPRIIVSTRPAELLITDALPDYRPIKGTALQYAADTDSQLFFHNTQRAAYLLLSGRWFRAQSLRGPWEYISPRDLPEDFARISPNSPQAIVLASVPDTPQAELAIVANSAPTTATVNRRNTSLKFEYDGEPKFKSIEGTGLNYALNAPLPVIRTNDHFYAVENGVWFTATSATGPWEVAAEVPEEIYTIPPSSPVYYATFVRVYDADDETVEVGYTPGYTGSYEDEGTMVYGTGWNYEPWYGNSYYGWGWSWGYSYVYVPWYRWWLWRPWWNNPGGLRAAVVDDIYARWQPNSGVAPGGAGSGSGFYSSTWPGYISPWPGYSSEWKGYSSEWKGYATEWEGYDYPAMYGRFKGRSRPGAMTPPPNTLALNPYARPQTSARAGETPRGAQLLTTIRQAPGGGRDLYASPDGNVYSRRSDGWYRRQAGGNWAFYAPPQGQSQRSQTASVRTAQPGGGGNAAARVQGRTGRVPDAGSRVQAQEVAALERQYYARALANARTRNVRPAYNTGRAAARPVRGGRR